MQLCDRSISDATFRKCALNISHTSDGFVFMSSSSLRTIVFWLAPPLFERDGRFVCQNIFPFVSPGHNMSSKYSLIALRFRLVHLFLAHLYLSQFALPFTFRYACQHVAFFLSMFLYSAFRNCVSCFLVLLLFIGACSSTISRSSLLNAQ